MTLFDLKKIENLTLGELKEIATEVGINFTIGNENIKDKQEFLQVLDEAEPYELEQSYRKVLEKRGNRGQNEPVNNFV